MLCRHDPQRRIDGGRQQPVGAEPPHSWPNEMMQNVALTEELTTAIAATMRSGEVKTRAADRYALANDASHYMLVPQAVVVPRKPSDVANVLRVAGELRLPLTFRSGGTSLSGQGVTDSILVDTRRHFQNVEVLDDGVRVRVQPGVTVRQDRKSVV